MGGKVLDLIIKDGRIITPDGHLLETDLGVKSGKIAGMGPNLQDIALQTVSAAGCIVLPGIIDLHTHLRSPVNQPELFINETASAVAGGITTVGDFAYPPGSRFELPFDIKRERLSKEALCDFCLHTVLRMPEHLENIQTYTVKVFFTASGLGAQASAPLGLLQKAVEGGHQVLAHVEAYHDYQSILDHGLSAGSSGRVHILHVPHQRFVQQVSAAENERITLETCLQYLLWEWTRHQPGADVNPAIQPADLWPEVKAGRISTLGTDHCSYTWQEKQDLHLPGFPGLETLLRLTVTFGVAAGRISWADLCRVLCSGPARTLGLYPQKGALQAGSDADFVIYDPNADEFVEKPRYGRGDFTPYRGLSVQGRIVSTFVRGRRVYHEGSVDLAAAGWGRWQDKHSA
jgi:dihydroorotase-like cyclic amidohydrolase